MTSLLIWSQPFCEGIQNGVTVCACVCVCVCVVSGSGRQTGEMWPILDADLPNTAGKHDNGFLEPPAQCTLLALFPKELSCCVTMEINDCWCWNALIIMENRPRLINYPDKLLFLLIQFSLTELEKGKTQNLLRFVEANWSNFKWTSNKRHSIECLELGIPQQTGRTEGEGRVSRKMVELIATQSTTINKHWTDSICLQWKNSSHTP